MATAMRGGVLVEGVEREHLLVERLHRALCVCYGRMDKCKEPPPEPEREEAAS